MFSANSWIRSSSSWQLGKRYVADPVRRAAARLTRGDRLPLFWFDIPNWGDALNPYLARKLSGRDVQHLEGLYHERYLAVGSVLGAANARTEVWGSGFISEGERVMERPRAVHAVRGPLSRDALLQQGVDCPEVFGDPALLLPLFLDPELPKSHKIGIVPHYVDKNHPWLDQCRRNPEVQIIDVESGTEEFVRSLKSCEVVLSSSLHGLICADAYGIPNLWVQLSDRLIGGEFKFNDYRLSISAEPPTPIHVAVGTDPRGLAAFAKSYPVNLDLRRLILACPFLSDELRGRFAQIPEPVDGKAPL
jgi:pyruvyltransferase